MTKANEAMIEMAKRIGERNTGTFTVHPEHGVRQLDDETISLIRQTAINAALAAIMETQRLAADELSALREDVALWKREAANRSEGMVQLNLDRAALSVENMQLRERVAELEGALHPFATAAEDIDERTRGDSNMWEHPASMNVYASDFREARAALSAAIGEDIGGGQ